MPKRTLTDAVLEVLREHEPGRLLDIPAGDGPIASGAAELGYRVTPLDLFPGEGFRGVKADACAPLPFADGAFDVVVTMEGVEHFENQAGFLRECARVLKPGGLLVLTTPNVMHLSARVSQFWTMQRGMKRGFINEAQTLRGRDGEHIHHGHAFLIDAIRLRYLLELEGVTITGTRRARYSSGSLAMAPLIPLVRLATRVSLRSGRRTRAKEGLSVATPEIEADLARLSGDANLLLCRQLVLTGVKQSVRPGAAPAATAAVERPAPAAYSSPR